MRRLVPFFLVALVLCEAALFVAVVRTLGFLPALALGLLSTAAGIVMLRRQGLATLVKMRAEAKAGRLPAKSLLEGAVLASAALLMVLPGFLTDIVGLLLFIPAVRGSLGRRIVEQVALRARRRHGMHPASAGVVELDQSQYAFQPRPEASQPRGDSPWQHDGRDVDLPRPVSDRAL